MHDDFHVNNQDPIKDVANPIDDGVHETRSQVNTSSPSGVFLCLFSGEDGGADSRGNVEEIINNNQNAEGKGDKEDVMYAVNEIVSCNTKRLRKSPRSLRAEAAGDQGKTDNSPRSRSNGVVYLGVCTEDGD
ncbi:hypothetical protein NDU88_004310 [Pleurodeles waltl]|uniref:Uncharacterized protein n=1 Tax=Pleurodeles waltl TaxID=8319 RepID=A0AAV7QFR3_PLEWA|nr:hypothetical protein NDU88_004310 [Pleurodeles waltl]